MAKRSTTKRGATKKQLGKGIGALLKNIESDIASNNEEEVKQAVKELSNVIAMIPIEEIERNNEQPRVDFDEEALEELATSIKALGLIQPLTVRRMADKQYQLISGERRFRASKLVGLKEVPAYIRIANDQEMLEMALVENIQRENLNPIEISTTYQRLKDECKLTDAKLSERVGKKRSTITNYLSLLALPPKIQQGLKEQKITTGHGKALKSIDDFALQISLYNQTIDEGLSVRALEEQVRRLKEDTGAKPKARKPKMPDGFLEKQKDLREFLGAKVQLKVNNEGKGQIVIPFSNVEDFNRLLDVIDL